MWEIYYNEPLLNFSPNKDLSENLIMASLK